jgi:hypothetical protein
VSKSPFFSSLNCSTERVRERGLCEDWVYPLASLLYRNRRR